MKRLTLIGARLVLLAGGGAAIFMAAAHQPATRSAELENFHLVGPTGRPYSIESFPPGSVLAIYFGYTTCLRACPTALDDLAEAIDRIGAHGASIQPVFIDMDPDRAAPVSLPLYMEAFGPSFLGLTGPSDDIEQAAKSFKVKVRTHAIQRRSDRLCDDAPLADLRDAAQRPPPIVAAGYELARDNRGRAEERALVKTALGGLLEGSVLGTSGYHGKCLIPRISLGLWTCSGSRRRERESSTPPRLSSRPRGSRWHALCSPQDWS